MNPESHKIAALAGDAENLQQLEASGALGRWQASQYVLANIYAPYLANAKTFWGGTMQVDIRERVSSSIYIFGIYEPTLSAFFSHYLESGKTFVDVGSHYGYFSLLAAHRVGESGKVISIEPSESTSWRLYHNIKGLKCCSNHRVAAWKEESMLTLNDYGPVFSAFNSIGKRRIHESAPPVKSKTFEVRAVALDQYFSEIGVVPDMIKIDAESAELEIIQGLHNTLSDVRPVVTLEVGDYEHLIAEGVTSSREILEAVAKYEYDLFVPTLKGLEPHPVIQEQYSYGNIIAVPREKALA